jgi:hypothetical chaperone protein
MLRGARVRALEPDKIAALSELIEADLGYQLHQAVQRTKVALSGHEQAEFRFDEPGLHLRASVTRQDFESWIEDDLNAIRKAVAQVVNAAGVPDTAVDRVFLTGGSSLVPAVRRIFEERFGHKDRFGQDRVRTGDAFTSVASGLALRARAAQPVLTAR